MSEVLTILLLVVLACGLGWLWINALVFCALFAAKHGIRFHTQPKHWVG